MYDVQDERGVPVSKGVPMIVRVAGVVGLIAIFAVGYDVIAWASYGHQWPAERVLRMPMK